MKIPRVIITSAGIYHTYHAARAAEKCGSLERFITGIYDPRQSDGIAPEHIQKVPLPNYLGFAIQQIPSQHSVYIQYLVRDNLYDRLAQRYITPVDVFHGWNHQSLYSLRKAKEMGAVTLIERSTAHPTIQTQILEEEMARFGLNYPASAKWLNEKHIQEYDEADYIVTCSEFVDRTFIEMGYPAEKLKRIHLGFDASRFAPAPKQDDVFRIVYAGMITIRKGIHYLLEAFKQLNIPNSELVLVGALSQDSKLFLPQYEGLYTHIPFVTHDRLPELFQSASVFVMPSIEDGFGMVVYEAAACGVPVIATENVGAALRDGIDGFVVPIRDAKSLAERITQLYEDPDLRERMGQSARAYVSQYTWEAYHQQMAELYQQVVQR